MINWIVPAILFALAALLAAWLSGRLQGREGWSKWRRRVTAALPLPMLAVAGSATGIMYELLRPRTGSTMTDLAIAVYIGVGGLLALLTFAGGLVGSTLAEREPN